MKRKNFKYFFWFVLFCLAVFFIAKVSGPRLLKIYIDSGMGDCSKIPILCMAPSQDINNPEINKEFLAGLMPKKFPKITIFSPKGFAVVQELIKKPYYKAKRNRYKDSVIYILHLEKNYFPNLYPQVKGIGINDNYGFISRLMDAKSIDIKGIDDAFFIIMKSIFIPDLGDQKWVVMARFSMPKHKGFISYNIFGKQHYFDCNMVTQNGDFYKVYIKDKSGVLDLSEAFTIISTVE